MTAIDKWSLLAGLRFVLASIVAINHLGEFTDLGFLAFIPRFGAFEAILGFLLISGYSVTFSYLKEPESFLFRRLKRLYPIYFASILIVLFVGVVTTKSSWPSASCLLLNALFLNQIFTTYSYVGPAWSLSLEFWLYCLVPALAMARPAWNRALVYVSFASYLLYTAGRTLLHLPYYSGVGYGANLLFLSFIWICGLRLACERDNFRQVMWDIRLIFAGHIACAACIQLMSRLKHQSGDLFLYHDSLIFMMQAATLVLVYSVFSRGVLVPELAPRSSRSLRFLGDVSYPLYLIHIPIYTLLKQTSLKAAIPYYCIAVIASAALYWLVDFYSKRRHLQLDMVSTKLEAQ